MSIRARAVGTRYVRLDETHFTLGLQLLQLLRFAIGLELPQMLPTSSLLLVDSGQRRLHQILVVLLVLLVLVLFLFLLTGVALGIRPGDLVVIGRSRHPVIMHVTAVVLIVAAAVTLQIRHRATAGDGAGLIHRIHPYEATRLARHDGSAALMTMLLLLLGILTPHLDIGVKVTAVLVHRILEVAVAEHIAAHDIAVIRQAYRVLRLTREKNMSFLHLTRKFRHDFFSKKIFDSR